MTVKVTNWHMELWGTAAILYPGVLKEIAGQLGGSRGNRQGDQPERSSAGGCFVGYGILLQRSKGLYYAGPGNKGWNRQHIMVMGSCRKIKGEAADMPDLSGNKP